MKLQAAPVFTLTVIVAALTLSTLHSSKFALDPGVGWHLKTGELIATERTIPRVDPFLELPDGATPRPWVSDQWLSDLLLFKTLEATSWPGIHLLLSLVFYSAFFSFLYLHLKRSTNTALAPLLASLLAFKLAQVHFLLRPVVFAFPLFTVVWIAARNLAVASPSPTRIANLIPAPSPVWLVPLFLLWSNLHPSFVLGLGLLGFATVLRSTSLCSTGQFKHIGQGALPFLLCIVATLVNPYGINLHRSIVELSQSEFFMNFHVEWRSPDFKSVEGELFMMVLGIIFVGTLLKGSKQPKVSLFDLLGFLGITYLTLRSIRYLPFFGIVAAPIIVDALNSIGSFLCERVTQHWATAGNMIRNAWQRLDSRELLASTVPAHLIVVGLLILNCLKVGYVEQKYAILPFSPEESGYPPDVIQVIKENSKGEPGAVYAEPALGGYLTLRLFPALRGVIDDRNTMLGEDFYRAFFASQGTPERLTEFLHRYNVSYVVTPKSSTVAQYSRRPLDLPLIYSNKELDVFKVRID